MRSLAFKQLESEPEQIEETGRVLSQGGLVCLPCSNSYRIVADLTSEDAVERLLQSKSRTRKAPSLVFVDSEEMLRQVAAEVNPAAVQIARRIWPQPVTILFDAHPELPRWVVKQLVRANGKIGVRIPDNAVVTRVISALGRPLLVSSANKERKKGAGSPAQVKKNFAKRIDLFIDAGELPQALGSTVVDVEGGQVTVTRPGSITADRISDIVG